MFTLLLISSLLNLWGESARVLLHEDIKPKALRGELRWEMLCNSGQSKTCKKKSWRIPVGEWAVRVDGIKSKGTLKLHRKGFAKEYSFPGDHHRLTGNFQLQGQSVHHIEIHRQGKNFLWVGHIDLEEYLLGVLAGEVPLKWPEETLKAQIVASRTYFLFRKGERKGEAYDVRSDILDQVFRFPKDKKAKLVRLVRSTQGEVLVGRNGEIFPAYFHADCGGQTAQEAKVWRKPSSLHKIVQDPYCQQSAQNDWVFKLDRELLERRLKQTLIVPTDVKLSSILPRGDQSHRAEFVDLMFSNQQVYRLSADEFRKSLGYAQIRSAQFSVEERWDSFVFRGRGFGHGVGMCQWGAQRWAKQGKSYSFILKHYYPDARITQLKTLKNNPQAISAQVDNI